MGAWKVTKPISGQLSRDSGVTVVNGFLWLGQLGYAGASRRLGSSWRPIPGWSGGDSMNCGTKGSVIADTGFWNSAPDG